MRRRLVGLALAAVLVLACGGQDADDQTVEGPTGLPSPTAPTPAVPVAPPGGVDERDFLLTTAVPLEELRASLGQVAGARVVQEVEAGRVLVVAPLTALPELARLPGVQRAEIAP